MGHNNKDMSPQMIEKGRVKERERRIRLDFMTGSRKETRRDG